MKTVAHPKRLRDFVCAVAMMLLCHNSAAAQATAQPVVTGYLTTSGCPYGLTTCFVQYGSGGSGTPSDVTIVGPLGTGSAATGVRSTLDATDAAALQSIVANTTATVLGAGTAVIGKVGIDQTTPGTTNGVQTLSGSVTSTSPSSRTIVALDVATVTTGGTAVTALSAGHRTAGGFLVNPKGATIDLCINEQATASGTTTAGGLICIAPAQSYTLAPSALAVSVVTSDSSHPFGGYGLN